MSPSLLDARDPDPPDALAPRRRRAPEPLAQGRSEARSEARTGARSEARESGACRLATAIAAAGAGLGVERIVGRERSTARVALTRQLAMYLAHVGLGLPQSGVAEAFGRDRSTVAHACRRIEDLRDDPAFDRQVAQMEASLRWASGR